VAVAKEEATKVITRVRVRVRVRVRFRVGVRVRVRRRRWRWPRRPPRNKMLLLIYLSDKDPDLQ
jgi:hypothetical protein